MSQVSAASIKEQVDNETRIERNMLSQKEKQRREIASLLVKQQEEKFESPSKGGAKK